MRPLLRTMLIGSLALASASPSFAQTRFIRLTNSFGDRYGSEYFGPAGDRPSLSTDGTVALYTTLSVKDNVHILQVRMDKIALTNPPTLVKGGRIDFPTGAPAGANSYVSASPSMSGNGSIVALTAVYPSGDGEYRDHLRIFSVGPNNIPQPIFEKSGDEVDSLNSVRVSRNGNFVSYSTVEYLEEQGGKSTVYLYDVRSKSEKAIWSAVSDSPDVGVKGVSDDGKRILLGSSYESEPFGGNISLLDVSTGGVIKVTDIKDSQSTPMSVSWDGDGIMTAFSASTPLLKTDTNRALDVYLASIANPKSVAMLRISSAGNTQANYSSGQPEISKNGRYVAFVSRADNLRPSDNNYAKDLYVYSLARGGLISYVSGNEDINGPAVSDDGAVVAFVSSASNLAPNDTANTLDVFVGRPTLLRRTAGNVPNRSAVGRDADKPME